MSKLGAFVAGLGTGYVSGSKLKLDRERADREKERFGMEKERYQREKGEHDQERSSWKDLADLAEKYGGFSTPSRIEQNGVLESPPGAQSVDAPGGETSMPPATPMMPAAVPEVLRTETEAEESASPRIEQSGTEGAAGTSRGGETGIGPRTNEDRLGYALYRKPDLFANPAFLNDAAKLFLKAGMPQGVRWLEAGSRLQRENWPKAMQMLNAGDPAGAEEAFNATGRMRVVRGSTKEIGEGKWQSTLEGGETKILEPLKYMRAMLSPKEFFTLDKDLQKIKSDAEDRKAAREERRDTQASAQVERERHNKAMEGLQGEMLQIRKERGVDAETAMIKNINYLVKTGVVKDHREAYDRLHTAMEKPENDAILSVATTLMRAPAYFGKNGATRAMQDAQNIVGPLKRGKGGGAEGAFRSKDDVRAAFRAGRINRAEAEKILQDKFNFEP